MGGGQWRGSYQSIHPQNREDSHRNGQLVPFLWNPWGISGWHCGWWDCTESEVPIHRKNLSIEEAVKSTAFCLESSESGLGYELKKDHVYWHQVHGEMYFLHRKFCFFFCLDHKDVAILKIEKDEAWAANIPRLTQFYYNHLFQKDV